MDVGDRAKKAERRFRKQSLKRQRFQPKEKPRTRGSKRICLDCLCEIPKRRLEAQPDAVRCVICEDRNEFRNRNQ